MKKGRKRKRVDPRSYTDVFMGGGDTLTQSARAVLRDLATYSRFYDDTLDSEEVLRYAGRRDMYAYILYVLNFTDEEFALYKREMLDER